MKTCEQFVCSRRLSDRPCKECSFLHVVNPLVFYRTLSFQAGQGKEQSKAEHRVGDLPARRLALVPTSSSRAVPGPRPFLGPGMARGRGVVASL